MLREISVLKIPPYCHSSNRRTFYTSPLLQHSLKQLLLYTYKPTQPDTTIITRIITHTNNPPQHTHNTRTNNPHQAGTTTNSHSSKSRQQCSQRTKPAVGDTNLSVKRHRLIQWLRVIASPYRRAARWRRLPVRYERRERGGGRDWEGDREGGREGG